MRRWLGLVLSVVAFGSLAACGDSGGEGSSTATEPAGSSSPTTATVPKLDTTATMRFIYTGAPTNWDPAKSTSETTDGIYMSLVYDPLIKLDYEGKYQPGLAMS